MTMYEENELLREKIKDYESLLEKVMEGPFFTATLISKSIDTLCRIATDDGKEFVLNVNPKISPFDLKEGKRVLCNQHLIMRVLPTELEKTPEPVKFDFIEWSQIGGMTSQLQRIHEAVEGPIENAKFYKQYGLNPCKGILLYGPPGCGKTMIARAIASAFLKGKNITKDSFIYMKGGEMLSPYVGMAEANIKSCFTRARNNYEKSGNRSVIFIDEAEALLPARGSRRSSDVDTTIVPTFLSEMDGFETNSTFIILATNYPNQLDPAVIRPGRIDLKVEIGRPTMEDSIDIFKLYLEKTNCKDNVKKLAVKASEELFKSSQSSLVSGALIKNIVDNAALSAIRRAISGKNTGVTEEDIVLAINNHETVQEKHRNS